jgi:hypothetical protein
MEKGGGKKKMVRDPKSVTFVKVATFHVLHLARRYTTCNWTSFQPECAGYGHNQIVWDRTHKECELSDSVNQQSRTKNM